VFERRFVCQLKCITYSCFLLQATIESSLPSASPAAALQGLPCVAELKQLMREVDNVKTERDRIENQLKEANCDMGIDVSQY
jgi:hypothetical protein